MDFSELLFIGIVTTLLVVVGLGIFRVGARPSHPLRPPDPVRHQKAYASHAEPIKAETPAIEIPPLSAILPHLRKVTSRPEPATEYQLRAIQKIGFDPTDCQLTLGQASALISAKVYAEGAMFVLIKKTDEYAFEQLVEANLAAFIVSDDALRDRALAWNERRYARGHTGTPRPKRDQHLERVMDEADRLYKILIPVPWLDSGS